MVSFSRLFVAAGFASQAVLALPNQKRDVQSFIDRESPIAYNGILCNIGPSGACVSGAGSGLVIASPSRNNPPCK